MGRGGLEAWSVGASERGGFRAFAETRPLSTLGRSNAPRSHAPTLRRPHAPRSTLPRLPLLALLLLSLLLHPRAALAQPLVGKIVITNVGPAVVGEALVRANIHVKEGQPY